MMSLNMRASAVRAGRMLSQLLIIELASFPLPLLLLVASARPEVAAILIRNGAMPRRLSPDCLHALCMLPIGKTLISCTDAAHENPALIRLVPIVVRLGVDYLSFKLGSH